MWTSANATRKVVCLGVLTEHREIVEGLRSRDEERAAVAMTRHLTRKLATLKLPIAPIWRQVREPLRVAGDVG